MRSRYSQFLFYSLLLHLILLAFFSSSLISSHNRPLQPKSEAVLTLIEPPSQATPPPAPNRPDNFMPTVAAQEVTQSNPKAILESDRNTRLQSNSAARDATSAMADMRGDKRASLSYFNVPQSTGRTEIDSAPSAPSPPQSSAPATTSPSLAQNNRPRLETSPPPTPTPVYAVDAQPVLPPQIEPTPEPEPSSPPVTEPQTAPRPPPMEAFSLSKSRSDNSGAGNGMDNIPSPETRETELGRYKSKIYRAIGSRWYLNVDNARTDLSIGTVQIKFFIRDDGSVSHVEVVEDTGSQLLRTISLKAVLDSAPFEPFSDSLKQQLGEGYPEQFTFSIY